MANHAGNISGVRAARAARRETARLKVSRLAILVLVLSALVRGVAGFGADLAPYAASGLAWLRGCR